MEFRQVQCFLAVAELRHFGRAADRLGIVQPAVSQQVSRLERELGTPLFRRTTRVVELTPAGAAFLPHAREVIAAADRAGQAARGIHRAGTGLRVGTGSGLGDLLGRVLEELARRQPGLPVELIRLPERERVRRLADGALDAAVARGVTGPPSPGTECVKVLSEALVAALPAASSTPRRRTVRLAELAAMGARLPARDRNPVLFDALSAAWQSAGLPLRLLPAGPEEDMLALIATGPPSWTVFYPHKAELLARQSHRGVAFRRITAPSVTVTTSVLLRADRPQARMFSDAFGAVTVGGISGRPAVRGRSSGCRPTAAG